jgi:hypothetical protein
LRRSPVCGSDLRSGEAIRRARARRCRTGLGGGGRGPAALSRRRSASDSRVGGHWSVSGGLSRYGRLATVGSRLSDAHQAGVKPHRLATVQDARVGGRAL